MLDLSDESAVELANCLMDLRSGPGERLLPLVVDTSRPMP